MFKVKNKKYLDMISRYAELKLQEKQIKHELEILNFNIKKYSEEMKDDLLVTEDYQVFLREKESKTLDKPSLIYKFGEEVINGFMKITKYKELTIKKIGQ